MFERLHITFLVNVLIYICVMMLAVILCGFFIAKNLTSFLHEDGRSCHPDLNDGGALQISVQGFQIDYYPFHLAKTDRSHWPK